MLAHNFDMMIPFRLPLENPLCKINHFIDKINSSPPFFLSYILVIIGCMLKKGQR